MKPFLFFTFFTMITNSASSQHYLFYLHGKIVEDQGDHAVSPYFGTYEYSEIVSAFRKEHFTVMSEVRQPNTDVRAYAGKVKEQIDSLLKNGTDAKDITIVGASKGALIAMYVSTLLKNREVNFVFLAACNDDNFNSFPDLQLYGNILSIYEKSDDIGGSCVQFKNKSSATIAHYKEIEINTGKQHGFLFQPLPEWVKPAVKWATGDYE